MFIQTKIIKLTANPGEVTYELIAINTEDVFSVEYQDHGQLLVTFKNQTTMLLKDDFVDFVRRLNSK